MINFMVRVQSDSECNELVEAGLPVLKKYGLLDPDYTPADDTDGRDRLGEVVSLVEESDTDRVLVFDAECVEDPQDYAGLARDFFGHAGLQDKLVKVKSDFNPDKEKAGLAMLIDGVKEKNTWQQKDDWVSQDFVRFMDETFHKHFNKKVLTLPAVDQCMRIMVVDAEDYDALSGLFEFHDHGYGPRELFSARFVSTVVLAAAGFVVCTLAGWYFLGFWWSLLASFGLWAIAAVVLIVKYSWQCLDDEEAEKLMREDPEAYGKAVMTAMLDEVANRAGDSEMGERFKKVAEINRARG